MPIRAVVQTHSLQALHAIGWHSNMLPLPRTNADCAGAEAGFCGHGDVESRACAISLAMVGANMPFFAQMRHHGIMPFRATKAWDSQELQEATKPAQVGRELVAEVVEACSLQGAP